MNGESTKVVFKNRQGVLSESYNLIFGRKNLSIKLLGRKKCTNLSFFCRVIVFVIEN